MKIILLNENFKIRFPNSQEIGAQILELYDKTRDFA